ncbi:MAG: CDP-diacylglycerol--glycerol-3-phosphate 3-phosphatidyltransferase [Oscillospiraceae bacterium]|nr:CDP-diacylglycerol--glycerol-3-phosphate 3-phosphatidyltransferase [Oscillospiraceae bacterium]
MNLPNKLTLMRIILVPFFMLFLYWEIPYHYTIALVIFAAASITDALDGKIARKYNLITTFGKFADPLADKILVLAAFACLADVTRDNHIINGVVVTIIAAREFMVSGLRLVTAEKGVVVAAGIWGKLKTAFTMVTIVLILICLAGFSDFHALPLTPVSAMILSGLVWISVLLTVISGGIYLKGYAKYIDMK